MKSIHILLAITLLVLSCLPCVDGQSKSVNDHAAISQQTAPHHNDDACSPLCLCSCCGCQGVTFAAIYQIIHHPIKRYCQEKVTILYNQSFAGDYFVKIWQPPQLV